MAHIILKKDHFLHNIGVLATQAGSVDKLAIVLKDNAYGHGLELMAKLAQEAGVKHAVVRTLEEAQTIQTHFETVLVLADLPTQSTPSHIHITVNSMEDLQKLPKQTAIELKVDTGMHRHGIKINELSQALQTIQTGELTLKGVFTHFRAADALNSHWFWQTKQFETVKTAVTAWATQHALPQPRFHSANSAGLFRFTHFSEDIARIGIAAYGLLNMPDLFALPKLLPVLELRAKKIASFQAHAGERLGYDGIGTIEADTMVSTYDVGYADGLLRLDDATTYTNASNLSIIGRVSMDNIIVDSTQDAITVFDDATAYAKAAKTISYEVVVRLAPHIKRTVS